MRSETVYTGGAARQEWEVSMRERHVIEDELNAKLAKLSPMLPHVHTAILRSEYVLEALLDIRELLMPLRDRK